jgi:hypothetical protein
VTEAELKNGFMEFMDTSFKQGLAAFKNNKFAVDPAKQERLLNLFKNDVLLSATELRETVRKRQLSELFKDDPIARDVKKAKRDISELLYIDEKNLPRFNTQTGLNLDIRTVNNIKSKIKTNLIDDTVFSKIKDKNANASEKVLKILIPTFFIFGNSFLSGFLLFSLIILLISLSPTLATLETAVITISICSSIPIESSVSGN